MQAYMRIGECSDYEGVVPVQTEKTDNLAGKALGIILVTGVSKVIGFLRSAVLAAYFGTTWQTDAFYMAQNVVALLSSALSSGFTASVVPIFTEETIHGGKRQADRYASSLTNLVIVFTLVLSAAAFIFAPQLVSIFAPQFEGLQAALTVQMVRALMCIVVMTALINVFSGLLNAQQRFIPAQLIGFPLSIAMIAFAVFASKRFGVQAMVYGLVVGTVGQLLLMMLSLKGVFKYAPIMNIRSKAIRKTFAMTIPAFLGTSLDLINQAVDKALASGLVEGSISAISYATQLTTLVNALIAAPIALTIFTSLSKYEATGD